MSTQQFASMTAEQARGFRPDPHKQAVRARLAALVGARDVLDVGCGPAEEVGDLFTPAQYTGVDCSVEMVMTARRRWPGYTFYEIAAQDLPGFGYWPVAITKAVLEHLPSHEAVEAYEAMRAACGVLYVAWHTEPRERPLHTTYRGELGRMSQNRHQLSLFHGVLDREAVDGHVIWTVRGSPRP